MNGLVDISSLGKCTKASIDVLLAMFTQPHARPFRPSGGGAGNLPKQASLEYPSIAPMSVVGFPM